MAFAQNMFLLLISILVFRWIELDSMLRRLRNWRFIIIIGYYYYYYDSRSNLGENTDICCVAIVLQHTDGVIYLLSESPAVSRDICN